MPPIIVHQSKEYYRYIHYYVPRVWIVHHTPPGYMDRDRWLKYMIQFLNVCSDSPVKNQILFFDGNSSHFDDGVIRQIMCKNIQPFVLKSEDSIINQSNDNVPNAKLRSLYNVTKSAWMLKYGTTIFHLTT